ncbi:MAG TPA: DUF6569 family protein [Terriglobales bacterium]|nr:DUF6569 family protein [Terriglobales bacterium]
MTALRALLALAVFAAMFWSAVPQSADAGLPPQASGYRVLEPISHGNLTIFPVAASTTFDTSRFLTLDEGLASGEVVVTEAGQVRPLIRGPRTRPVPQPGGGDVNRLVLVNNSSRPLLLLAGEIVTGGKQDRVVGKDRIIPAHGDADLSVFCVEPGRWTATSDRFQAYDGNMAQPSVRAKAMGDKDQQKVWEEVHKSNQGMAEVVAASPAGIGAGSGSGIGSSEGQRRAAAEIASTSSYARVMANDEVKKRMDEAVAPIAGPRSDVLRRLRAQKAIGVVVAVNGRIIWADLFASTDLLSAYWEKLVRSYAAEALTDSRTRFAGVSMKAAQAFLDDFEGTRQVVETEPGVFRHTEISGSGFRAFELTSLLPKTGFDLHLSKMAE